MVRRDPARQFAEQYVESLRLGCLQLEPYAGWNHSKVTPIERARVGAGAKPKVGNRYYFRSERAAIKVLEELWAAVRGAPLAKGSYRFWMLPGEVETVIRRAAIRLQIPLIEVVQIDAALDAMTPRLSATMSRMSRSTEMKDRRAKYRKARLAAIDAGKPLPPPFRQSLITMARAENTEIGLVLSRIIPALQPLGADSSET